MPVSTFFLPFLNDYLMKIKELIVHDVWKGKLYNLYQVLVVFIIY